NSIRPLWTDVDLLHALLRMALLASARDVALRILAVEGVLSDADRAEPGRAGLWVLSGVGDRDRRVSRWSFLFSPLSRFDGGLSYVHLVNNPGSLYGYLRANGDQPMSAYLANQGDNPLAHGFNGPARG